MASEDGGFVDYLKSIPLDQIGYYYKLSVDYGIVDVIVHPLDFADVLIRLGYEPFPPIEEARLFYGRSLVLPGITSYVYYLYSIDGGTGLFRAVVPYVAGNLVYRHLSNYVLNRSPIPLEHPPNEPHLSVQFTRGNITHYFQTKAWTLFSNIVGLHFAYPFHVVAVRSMARFVTTAATKDGYRPDLNESWLDEVRRIKSLDELFWGCQARVFKEILFAVIGGGSFLLIMKFAQILKSDSEQATSLERSVEFIGNSIATAYTNPFRNISEIMIINRTDLPLGNPPFIEHYFSCWDACKNLRKDRKWKTSSSGGLFYTRRYYQGPTDMVNGHLAPKDTYFGPVYLPPYARGVDDLPGFIRWHYDAWNSMAVGKTGYTTVSKNPPQEPGMERQTRAGVALSEMKTTRMDKQAFLDISGLGTNSKSLYFYGSSSNPFGL